MFKNEEENKQKIFMYNPISIFYLIILSFFTLLILPFLAVAGTLVGKALNLPSIVVFIIFLLSLFGSQINIKLKETISPEQLVTYKTINFFGTQWRIPQRGYGNKKTILAINLGGAIIPLLLCLYILLYSIPTMEQNLTIAYVKILIAFLIVTFIVNRFAKPHKRTRNSHTLNYSTINRRCNLSDPILTDNSNKPLPNRIHSRNPRHHPRRRPSEPKKNPQTRSIHSKHRRSRSIRRNIHDWSNGNIPTMDNRITLSNENKNQPSILLCFN
jgi:glucan phosphoethanolaminetransferase (alkaline phosphatase superfamily)